MGKCWLPQQQQQQLGSFSPGHSVPWHLGTRRTAARQSSPRWDAASAVPTRWAGPTAALQMRAGCMDDGREQLVAGEACMHK